MIPKQSSNLEYPSKNLSLEVRGRAEPTNIRPLTIGLAVFWDGDEISIAPLSVAIVCILVRWAILKVKISKAFWVQLTWEKPYHSSLRFAVAQLNGMVSC